jgi:hypothetical protein
MEVLGKIKLIEETQTFGGNGFRKRGVVLTTDDQYPQMIMIEFVQDKVELLDAYQVGQDVKISINLRGREWINPQGEAKYFNSVQGWRVETVVNTNAPAQKQEPEKPALGHDVGAIEPDDLPF